MTAASSMNASSMNEHVLDDSAGDDSTRSRASGIVDVLDGGIERSPIERLPIERGAVAPSFAERSPVDRQSVDRQGAEPEASDVASAVEAVSPQAVSHRAMTPRAVPHRAVSHQDEDIEITTDHGERASASSVDDDTIEVSDDEIETAEPATYRASMPSLSSYVPLPASNGSSPPLGPMRSRPPARPSSRPRPSTSSSLPPPRSSRPSGVDPWALANKTLELSHANAYIVQLQELVAFRDARIIELEDNLAKARIKHEDLERRLLERRSSEDGSRRAAVREIAPVVEIDVADIEGELPAIAETRRATVHHVSGAGGSGPGLRDAPLSADAGAGARDRDVDVDRGLPDAERDSNAPTDGGADIVRDASEDDLQQISGIGPRFEAALRKQGITRLSQIAAWSEADVRQVAKALKIPKSRIVKGRWVEVAREVIGTRVASE
jgi:predicted flap endonuclease-1-like 5' DNA nuclease